MELYAVAACAGATFLSLVAPWSLALSPPWASAVALAFGAYGAIRYRDARVILRYRRNIRHLPRYVMTSRTCRSASSGCSWGAGSCGTKHTHRLMQTYRRSFAGTSTDARPTGWRGAWRNGWSSRRSAVPAARAHGLGRAHQPVRPLPPVGGLPRLHGIEPTRWTSQPAAGRARRAFAGAGHHARGGQTPARRVVRHPGHPAQERRRRARVVIVIDPKGDADLLKRMYVGPAHSGREGEFYVIFRLGWPDICARYNAVAASTHLEVATRIAGSSPAKQQCRFREFAWRFVNIIAPAP